MVFEKRNEAVDLKNYSNWWQWLKGASWKHPHGPSSTIIGLDDHPVVHIAYEDAEMISEIMNVMLQHTNNNAIKSYSWRSKEYNESIKAVGVSIP